VLATSSTDLINVVNGSQKALFTSFVTITWFFDSDMKTDSLFYKLFQQTLQLLLELAALELLGAENYQFRSEEIKQTSFRLDGVLTPPSEKPSLPLVFVEVQF